MSENRNEIRSMADLLRGGATLTDLSCPACSSPLFRLNNGELFCAHCKKRVIVVKEDEQIDKVDRLVPLGNLEDTLLAKIEEISKMMRNESDIEEIRRLNTIMATLLDNLDKVRNIGRFRT